MIFLRILTGIIVGLVRAILGVFAHTLTLAFSTLLSGVIVLAIVVGILIGVGATLGWGIFRCRK